MRVYVYGFDLLNCGIVETISEVNEIHTGKERFEFVTSSGVMENSFFNNPAFLFKLTEKQAEIVVKRSLESCGMSYKGIKNEVI
jgi:hypothetical protein